MEENQKHIGLTYRDDAVTSRVVAYEDGEELFAFSYERILKDPTFKVIGDYFAHLERFGYKPVSVGKPAKSVGKLVTISKPTRYVLRSDVLTESHHAKMLRKDAEGFAAAKPFVAPAIPQKLVQGPHAPIDGLTRCNDLGVRVLGSRG